MTKNGREYIMRSIPIDIFFFVSHWSMNNWETGSKFVFHPWAQSIYQ